MEWCQDGDDHAGDAEAMIRRMVMSISITIILVLIMITATGTLVEYRVRTLVEYRVHAVLQDAPPGPAAPAGHKLVVAAAAAAAALPWAFLLQFRGLVLSAERV